MAKKQNSKVEKKKKKDPNILIKIILFILVIIVCIVAYFVCSCLDFYNVKSVHINTNELKHYNEEQVLASIKQNVHDNILKIDLKKVQDEIYQLPYVKNIKISKVFPTTLKIEIEEKEPTYVVSYFNNFLLLDDEYKVLEIVEEYKLKDTEYLIKSVDLKKDIKPNEYISNEFLFTFKTAKNIYDEFNLKVEDNKIKNIDFNENKIILELSSGALVSIRNEGNFDYQMRALNEILKKNKDKKIYIDMTTNIPYSKNKNY